MAYLDMDHLVLLLLLLGSGLQAEGQHTSPDPDDVRLVGGASHCAGTLELKHQGDWKPLGYFDWTLKEAAVFCRELDCGSAVSVGKRKESSDRPVWEIRSDCVQSGSALRECVESSSSSSTLDLTCSDSVRLVGGTSLCSGRLEVKSNQSNQSNQRWSSVCEADFDQQDAEVVCRELGCGAPSVLQGALYGEAGSPVWSKEFQCGGHESALLDCRSSGSARNTCSPGKAVGLTCSEPVRLVGGASRCAGTLELKHQGDWRPLRYSDWTLKEAAVVCRDLDCDSAVSVELRDESSDKSVWRINSDCVQSGSALRECVTSSSSSSILDLTCSVCPTGGSCEDISSQVLSSVSLRSRLREPGCVKTSVPHPAEQLSIRSSRLLLRLVDQVCASLSEVLRGLLNTLSDQRDDGCDYVFPSLAVCPAVGQWQDELQERKDSGELQHCGGSACLEPPAGLLSKLQAAFQKEQTGSQQNVH